MARSVLEHEDDDVVSEIKIFMNQAQDKINEMIMVGGLGWAKSCLPIYEISMKSLLLRVKRRIWSW